MPHYSLGRGILVVKKKKRRGLKPDDAFYTHPLKMVVRKPSSLRKRLSFCYDVCGVAGNLAMCCLACLQAAAEVASCPFPPTLCSPLLRITSIPILEKNRLICEQCLGLMPAHSITDKISSGDRLPKSGVRSRTLR